MLNFDHVRSIAKDMKDDSFDYAEAFLQYYFDKLEYDPDYPFSQPFYISHDNIPYEADPQETIPDVDMEFIIDCTGNLWLTLSFIPYELQYDSDEFAKLVIERVLLKNGFKKQEEWTSENGVEKISFSRKL